LQQARKAIAQALALGYISESWLIGKKFDTHSPSATNIEVSWILSLLEHFDIPPMQRYFASIPPDTSDVEETSDINS
jgi:hypothetical protein